MPQKKLLLTLFVLLLVGVVIAMMTANWQTQDAEKLKAAQQQAQEDKSNITGEAVSFTVTEGEQKKWVIDAKEAVYFTDHSGATLKKVTGRFFDKTGKPVLSFTAPAGEYKTKDQQMKLTGGVSVAAIKEKTAENTGNDFGLTAPNMAWSSRSNIVVASGGITMKQGKAGTSTAQRCQFALDLSSISLEGGVVSQMGL